MPQRSVLYLLSALLMLSSLALAYLSGRLYTISHHQAIESTATEAKTPTATVSAAELQQILTRLAQINQQLAQLPPQLQQAMANALAEQTQANKAVHTAAPTTESTSTVPQIASTRPAMDNTWQNFLVSLGLINYHALEATAERLFLGEHADRSKAISALAVVGSPEVKAEIQRLILDEQESTDIRTAAIEAFNWQGQVATLAQLLQTAQPASIQSSAIYAARNTQFNEAEQQQLEQTLFSQFQQTRDNGVREAIIDYFVTEPKKLDKLLNQSNAQGIKYIIRQHYGNGGV